MTTKKKPSKKAKAPRVKLPPITIDLLAEHADDLEKAFGNTEPIAYNSISVTQLSVARHFGGGVVNGKRYIYNPVDDSLIREDVVRFMVKILKEKA